MKAHVIIAKGYEYDDNIYTEGEGGFPQLICFSKEDVESKVKELNIKEFKETSIRNYSYDIEDILNVDVDEFNDFNKKLLAKYGEISKKFSWDDNEYILHPMANEEECNKYLSMVSISFYESKETDIDMQSFRDYKINEVLK